jgi:hypothetical protein
MTGMPDQAFNYSGLFVLAAAAGNWFAFAVTGNRYVGIAAASWFLVGGMLAVAKGLSVNPRDGDRRPEDPPVT